jgi:hypothetical protein
VNTLKKLSGTQSRPIKLTPIYYIQNSTDFRFNRSSPLKTEYQTGTRTTLFTGLYAALWTLVGAMFVFLTNRLFPSPLISQVTGVVAGFAVGGFIGAWITQKQLAILEKKTEIVTTLRTILYLMSAGVIFIAVMISVASDNPPAWLMNGLGSSIFAGAIAILYVRFTLVLMWERKSKRLIFQERFRLYLAAQKPTNNPEYQKDLAAKIGEKGKFN